MISQNTTTIDNPRPPNWSARLRSGVQAQVRRPFVYGALVAFAFLYYYRPEDFIPGLVYIPMAKITGIFAIVALMVGLMSGRQVKIPRAVQFLWLMLIQMMLCVPLLLSPVVDARLRPKTRVARHSPE